jgi:hypothetical protein
MIDAGTQPAGDWDITVRGGFAWVFAPGDSSATIGPFRKPAEPADYHPHEMILRFHRDFMLPDTSLPFRTEGADCVFVLRGEVALLPDNKPEHAGGLTRNVSAVEPSGKWDDFFYVYNANRLKDPADPPGTMVDGWRNLLLARLDIRNGVLEVQPSQHTNKYDLINGGKKREQQLATHILYKPRVPAARIVFHTNEGDVSARPTKFEIAADCGCKEGPPGGRVPGFEVTFNMYKEPKAHLRFVPHYKVTLNPQQARDPGPDCPPRDFSF